jgi:hypothetical protein
MSDDTTVTSLLARKIERSLLECTDTLERLGADLADDVAEMESPTALAQLLDRFGLLAAAMSETLNEMAGAGTRSGLIDDSTSLEEAALVLDDVKERLADAALAQAAREDEDEKAVDDGAGDVWDVWSDDVEE